MNRFIGFDVIVHPLLAAKPKIQLSENFNVVSAEFKKEFNAWLEDYFGFKDSHAYVVGSKAYVSQRVFNKLTTEGFM